MVLQTWCPLKEGRELQTIQEELERKYDATRWKYGQLKALPPDKPSPFIGPIQVRRLLSPSFAKWFQNEEFVFSVESHLMRAPAYGYATPPTDFLLVRSPSGNWSLRRTNGTISVGQQQPLVKIQPPLASTIKDFEERRLVSYACRKLSQQVRKFGNRSNHGDTVIYVEELTNRFPILSEAVIKSRLKDRCQCSSIRGEEGSFTLKAMATHLPESELRQILSPEEVCAYDSCRMFKARMSRLGLHHVDRLTQIPSDKWKLALSLLPEEMKPIAQYIQRTIQTAPWIQSEGYHSWKGGKGHVSVVGPGEPSGRGLCCSFTKEHLRKSEEGTLPIKPQPVITGTKADLRRLGAEEAITALQGLPIEMQSMIEFEDLRKMDRWEIIRHVRAIATAAVQDGIDLSPELSKFARNPRSSVQIAMGLKRKVEQAFAKQLKLLRNEEVDTKLLPIKESGPLRRDEILSKTEKRRVHRRILMEDGNQSEILLNMDVYENIAWGGTEGVLQDDNGRRIIEGRRPVATVMEEQIVERPLMLKKPVIGNRSKTIAQFGQSRIVFNKNHLKKKPKRSRTKLTAEHIWGNRYHYFERKPRSKNRRRRQEIHFPHTIASVEQEELFKALSKPKSKRALQQALVKQQQKLASGEPMEEQEDTYLMRQASLLSELGLSGSLDLGSLAMDVKTKLPYKTKDGRRMTGRKVLNTKILNKIHALAIRSQFAKYFKVKLFVSDKKRSFSQFQVNKRVALDYSDFVAPADEIWLDKIGSKIRGLKYSTGQMFIDDFRKLRDNAAVYNTPGNGRYGGPQVVDYAEALLRLVEEEIQKQRDLIAEEEERIKAEDTEKVIFLPFWTLSTFL